MANQRNRWRIGVFVCAVVLAAALCIAAPVARVAKADGWVFDSFVWTDYTAQAKYVDSEDPTSVIFYDANVSNEVTAEPDCTAPGIRTYTAEYEGHTDTKTQEIAQTAHTYGNLIAATTATCTEAGVAAHYRCSECQQYFDTDKAPTTIEALTTPATGHDLVHHDAKAATCTEIGWDAYDTCTRCDHTTYVALPATGHDYGQLIAATTATCTEDGVAAHYQCATCHLYFDADKATTDPEALTTPALGHDLVHHEGQAPTCTEGGWSEYDTCTRCDYTTYAAVPAAGHKLVLVPAQDATLDNDGNVAYYFCAVCNQFFEDSLAAKTTTPEDVRIPKRIPTQITYNTAAVTVNIQNAYASAFDANVRLQTDTIVQEEKLSNLVKSLSDVLGKKEEVLAAYRIAIVRTLDEGEEVLQASDITDGSITVAMVMPESVQGRDFYILHVRAADDVERVDYTVVDNTVYIQCDKLATFVFVSTREGLSGGAIAGIAIGCVLFAAAVFSLMLFIIKRQ